MKIAVLGTGSVGQAFAARLTGLGHEVTIGTRDVTTTLERKAGEFATFADYLAQYPGVKLATFAEAAAFGEMIVNVSKGDGTLSLLESAGANNLKGKILIDISNPLDSSKGFPPCLIAELCNTNSLGEEIQKRYPDTKVVKTLNTMWNGLMLNPAMIGDGNHVNYICGNDAGAKVKVISLLYEFGWKNESILDLGDITNARGTEATLPIWLRVWGAKQTGAFNFNIVT
jgi:predicted dinucleotide-binding enzyme